MKKVSVIGLFCQGKTVSDGQSVKTRIVTQEIEKALGAENVRRIDTFGWKKHPAGLFANCVKAVWDSKNVIFLTDEGGIKVFPRLLQLVNVGHACKIHYYVVGGWLGKYLDSAKQAAHTLKKLDAIYVEIPAMQRELEAREFHNCVLVNKFRRIQPVSLDSIQEMPTEPFKLCYFSRIMREKGIEDCIEMVKRANNRAGRTKYTLDIFGQINPSYQEAFDRMLPDFPAYIRYGGIVDFQNSSVVLKDYFAMLFPTFYASEGYPNAVVDAFAAGLPVIATRWHYNEDIIHDWEDGILIDVGNIDQLEDAAESLTKDLVHYQNMRLCCLRRCEEYLPEKAIAKVLGQLQ